MNKFLAVVTLVATSTFIQAQNLVSNPGFELFNSCPNRMAEFAKVQDWLPGNTGTPEYFRTDCTFYEGKAHSGKGYMGLILFGDYPKAIEYAVSTLAKPLDANETYCLEFWIRAKESFVYIDQIGMWLTDSNPRIEMWAPIEAKASLNSKYNEPITPHLGWHRVHGEFTATGGEQYLTIGNFVNPDRHVVFVDEFVTRRPGWNSYYYIDDVRVELKGEEGCAEPVFELDSSEKPDSSARKDSLTKGITIFFDTDWDVPTNSEKARLEEWIEKVNWNLVNEVSLLGHTDSIGSFEYNTNLSKRRISQVQKLLISKLSGKPSFNLNYFGETKPATDNSTPEGRSGNRRVEILLNYVDQKRR